MSSNGDPVQVSRATSHSCEIFRILRDGRSLPLAVCIAELGKAGDRIDVRRAGVAASCRMLRKDIVLHQNQRAPNGFANQRLVAVSVRCACRKEVNTGNGTNEP